MLCRIKNEPIIDIENSPHWAYGAAMNINRHVFLITTDLKYQDLDAPISRVDAIVIGMQYFDYGRPTKKDYLDNPFVDLEEPVNALDDRSDYLLNAYQLRIISSTDVTHISPYDFVTRAEACDILVKLNSTDLSNDTTIIKPRIFDKVNIKFIGESSYTYYNDIALALSFFPESILDSFSNSGGTFIITDEWQTEYIQTNQAVSGCYLQDTNTIVCFTQGQDSSFMFSLTSTICHELGHYIYENLLSKEEQRQVKKSFESEELELFAKAIKRSYCKNDVEEYFAEIISYTAQPYMYGKIENIDFEHIHDIVNKYLSD